ncbi:hypothetical protein AGMMS50293_10750 [Spirochaetia bacterium]|nr:hypothetical protein AGMMS50293_10750 [Spirochaetia bacterium]
MCPDRQILSVYRDGELPSPWKEKMENHLEDCAQCRSRLENYRQIFKSVTEAPESLTLEPAAAGSGAQVSRMETAKERVWRNIEGHCFVPDSAALRRRSIWRRNIAIPLPAAAAAAVLIFVALAALWLRRPVQSVPVPDMILASEEDLAPENVPFSDMNGVLQYLGSVDSGGDILILRLPESRNFISSGEPAILRAADYSRNVPGRRQP